MVMEKIPLFKVSMAQGAVELASKVMQSGHIAQGPYVEEFEEYLSTEFGVPAQRVVTVNSGTSALHLAYHLIGIQPNDAVIATPMTCAATLTPLVHFGAKIFWADVNALTGNIDPTSVANLWERLCPTNGSRAEEGPLKAIVAVDWAGIPADYEGLRSQIPVRYPIVEDAAHAMFAFRPNGALLGPASARDNIYICHSFQAIKHLTTGDGGALICPTEHQADRARKLRWFGLDRRSKTDFRAGQDITEAGYKFHMNDIAASIGVGNLLTAKLRTLIHQHNADTYRRAFADLAPRVRVSPFAPHGSYWIYTLLVDGRESFQSFMAERGIETSQVHRRNDEHPAFPRSEPGSLPGLDFFSAHQVSIPVGWWVSATDVERIIEAVCTWAKQ